MSHRYISSRFERYSACIDLSSYERESRYLISAGVLVGLFLGLFVNVLLGHHSQSYLILPALRPTPVRIQFIERQPDIIRPVEDSLQGSVPVVTVIDTVKAQQEPPTPTEDIPTLERAESTPETESILRVTTDTETFTPFREGATIDSPESFPDTTRYLTWEDTFHGHPDMMPLPENDERWERSLPLSERSIVTLGQGYGSVFWDPLNPVEEEPEDERRRFDSTFLGIPMGRGMTFVVVPGMIGFTATGILPSIQHFVKRMKWNYDDGKALDNRRELQQAGFSALSEKDIRFLTLLWKYDRLNPDRLTIAERIYLSNAQAEYVTTNRIYLEDMVQRGLAVSLQKSGVIVYGATVTRDELLNGLITVLRQLYSQNTAEQDSLLLGNRDMITGYVSLITTPVDTLIQSVSPDNESTSQVSIEDSLTSRPKIQ